MNGREFIRRAQRYARRTDQDFALDPSRGKGSHVAVCIGNRYTIVKYSEISNPMLHSMLRQLGIVRRDF